MRSIKIGFAAVILTASILCFSSCKKDPAPSPTTQDKILGKWKMQTIVQNDFLLGLSQIDTLITGRTDYADFRKGGTVEIVLFGNVDTSPYGIISESRIWIGDVTDIFDIQELSATTLKLYRKQRYSGVSEYTEITYSFNR